MRYRYGRFETNERENEPKGCYKNITESEEQHKMTRTGTAVRIVITNLNNNAKLL